MLKYKEYVFAESLAQAYELNQKRNNGILAGNGWRKMSDRQLMTAIDLSRLGLDEITETEEQYTIGCMVTLRQIETHPSLNAYTDGAVKESVRHIVGTQFRNCATVGGSIYGRYGFSDVLTVFLAMNTYVELYKGGVIPLAEYAKMKYDRDILVHVIVKKTPLKMAYSSFRNQSTDFPVLTCAVAFADGNVRTAIGARPARAEVAGDEQKLLAGICEQVMTGADGSDTAEVKEAGYAENEKQIEAYAAWAADQFTYGSNMRAGAEYRKHIAKVLVKRTLCEMMQQ